MLESINVKNLALIKESEILLGQGLNILTGETGAGKSIILGSIRLALGERAKGDFVRTGADYASIELVFADNNQSVQNKLRELDIPVEEDGTIVIKRRLQEGRSTCRCNGETISGRDLRTLASMLINIHGQNDTQTLLDSNNYMSILDGYGGDEVEELLVSMEKAYRTYKSLKEELDREESGEAGRDKDIALAEFELSEIRGARIKAGEDEELEALYRTMNNSSRIAEAVGKAHGLLSRDGGAIELIDMSLKELNSAMQYTDDCDHLRQDVIAIEEQLHSSVKDMERYMDGLDFSREEYNRVEDRLNTINRLKSKYGGSVEAIERYAGEREAYLEKMTNHQDYLEKLGQRLEEAARNAGRIADRLTKIRQEKAKELQEKMLTNLQELNFQSVEFDIMLDREPLGIGAGGQDRVDFLVSFNLGEPVKSLSQVASGGELSRFMLALKAATAERDCVETIIFDEIDSGISGATAWKVSEKLGLLSDKHQVIAITHLPQIAAMADKHFFIEKKSEDKATVTEIRALPEEESIEEVARLLSTGEVTEALRNGACELKDRACKVKKRRFI